MSVPAISSTVRCGSSMLSTEFVELSSSSTREIAPTVIDLVGDIVGWEAILILNWNLTIRYAHWFKW